MINTVKIALEILRDIADEADTKYQSMVLHRVANILEDEIIRLEERSCTYHINKGEVI